MLVQVAYPVATEETTDMLAKNSFMDVLYNKQLQVHMKQAGQHNVQIALVHVPNLRICSPPPRVTLHLALWERC